ncbi:unnamed protein product [Cochlearia groenlandica]
MSFLDGFLLPRVLYGCSRVGPFLDEYALEALEICIIVTFDLVELAVSFFISDLCVASERATTFSSKIFVYRKGLRDCRWSSIIWFFGRTLGNELGWWSEFLGEGHLIFFDFHSTCGPLKDVIDTCWFVDDNCLSES